MERFLDGIDKVGQTKVDEVDRKAKERIHEGSERLWSAMNKGARIVVP
jgi:hypothetical protein